MRLSNGVRWLALAAAIFASGQVAAQSTATLTGRVVDESGAALSGAQIVITNQTSGAQSGGLSQSDGRYTVAGLRPGGPYRVETRMIGYGLQFFDDVNLLAGQSRTLDFRLSQEAIAIDAIEVFATRATARKTPVAFTDVPKVQIQNQLGSRDLPMVLNVTPSVYATPQGGGAGDARINVRGFNQRNTAVMINGVPVNDVENGWVYWSNWDGLGDAATSIQLQRGLSAVNLATPSIGGTLNVITDPTSVGGSFSYKQEFGLGYIDPAGDWNANRNLLKETFVVNTGEQGGFAMTASVVRKTGDGMHRGFFGGDATWTDAWAYYLAARYQINSRNRVELYAVGAPQRHGQNLYKLNLATLDQEFAMGLDDYCASCTDSRGRTWFEKFPEYGRRGSPNVNTVSTSYTGQQYSSTGPGGGSPQDRYNAGYLNERENYFHKPQVNLNWYSYLGSGLTWSTVAYYSGGNGGGTGTYGSSRNAAWKYDFTQRVPDWDGTIALNRDRGDSGYIIRNSVNNQWTLGAISKLRKDYDSGLTTEVGIDWRTAEVLLGGTHYNETFSGSDFWGASDIARGLGDKINYDNTNKVSWLGGYLQAEKTDADGSFYGMFGWAQNKYDYTDHFRADPANATQELNLNSGWISGYQLKGGVNRNITDEWSLFGNAGLVSKVPIFDGVIDDNNGAINPDPKNEKFVSFEAGANFRSMDRGLSADLNVYHTTWKDRTRNVFVRNLTGDNEDGLVNLLGVDAAHMGFEAKIAYQPSDLIRFDIAGSIGKWTYLDDVTGQYKPDNRDAETQTFEFFIKDLRVADAPQTQFAYSASLFPVDGMYLSIVGRTYRSHYAEFDPFSRTAVETDANGDVLQSWQAPGYTVFDLNLSYRLGDILPAAGDMRIFTNVYNLFDTIYVQDAVDNSRFNGFDGDHDADDAEVFLGYPRNINLGFQINF
jgi:hypothetical protein